MSGPAALFVVTGHPGAGKTTFAPRLAAELGAVLVSREEISDAVFDGWLPRHPSLLTEVYEAPAVNGAVFMEGKVSWDIFLLTIDHAVAAGVAVVAESPFNSTPVRDRFTALVDRLAVPCVEVLLKADLGELWRRVNVRAAEPGAHPVKARFTVGGAKQLLQSDFLPVLQDRPVLVVDTTDFAVVDVAAVAEAARLSVQ